MSLGNTRYDSKSGSVLGQIHPNTRNDVLRSHSPIEGGLGFNPGSSALMSPSVNQTNRNFMNDTRTSM